jgi:hypothetical protein
MGGPLGLTGIGLAVPGAVERGRELVRSDGVVEQQLALEQVDLSGRRRNSPGRREASHAEELERESTGLVCAVDKYEPEMNSEKWTRTTYKSDPSHSVTVSWAMSR